MRTTIRKARPASQRNTHRVTTEGRQRERLITNQRERRHIDRALYARGINNDGLNYRIQNVKTVKCEKERGIIAVDDVRYPYYCFEDDPHTLVFNGGLRDKRPCFALHVYPETKRAVLVSLETSSTCSLDPDAETVKTAGRAAFALAASLGVTEITLSDTAKKIIPGGGGEFIVSNMEFLTRGQSWYETFLPVKPEKNIAKYRKRALTNTWDQVYKCLCAEEGHIVPIPVDISDINTGADGSAALVFQRIKEARTDFFARYANHLLECSGLVSLSGNVWIAKN